MRRENRRVSHTRRIALVLGGGGLKGFAHIGVLRALEERHIVPASYAGTSIGALIASAYLGGMPVSEMTERAAKLRRRDLFKLNHMGMLLERMRVPSIYSDETLRALVTEIAPAQTFAQFPHRLLVNTVDLEHGTPVMWGLPGLTDVSIQDAVYASCALPGFFPPGRVDGRLCVDGGTIDNLPVAIAALGCDAVIAVDVGNSDLTHGADFASQGFAAIYMRAATVMMHSLQQYPLTHWNGPPMILIRPKVSHIGWFTFGHTAELIEEGYRAACLALDHIETTLQAPGGIFPRRLVQISVDRERCTGCGICPALAPTIMGLDSQRKAFARSRLLEWSPADGGFVHACPTNAITATTVEGQEPAEPAAIVSAG